MAPGADPDGPPPERDPYGDRRPPYSEDAEQAVLGAMMIDTDAVMRASEIVDDTMFYREAHRWLFRGMQALTERRDVAVARVPEAPGAESDAEVENEEYGPLGPGIRPADFWGA